VGRTKILVVDDDEAVLDYMRAKLAARYAIVATTEPQQVIELARTERPSLILCDIEMPGMDGGDLSAALHAEDDLRDIPLLFLTGLVTPGLLKAYQGQLGGRAAISKEAPIAELVARIDSLIR
jgi:CheY-like chemotaxis protein